jgi:hypothetical protein
MMSRFCSSGLVLFDFRDVLEVCSAAAPVAAGNHRNSYCNQLSRWPDTTGPSSGCQRSSSPRRRQALSADQPTLS